MPSKRNDTNLQASVASDCRHHWIIECSQQNESKGRCQLCGEERTFVNKMSSSPHKRPGVIVETLPLGDDISAADIPLDDDSPVEADDSVMEAF